MVEGFLVIDAGSGSVKTFVVSPGGKILRSAESLWNRNNWNTKIAKPLVLETIKKLELNQTSKIHGISVTSMREEFVLIDNKGKEVIFRLSPISCEYGEKILAQYGERMYDSSGHWPIPNWIAGAILPWLNDNHPEKISETDSILMISDWVNYILCGETFTEGSSACETALFDIQHNNWDFQVIEELDLPSHIFPEVKNNANKVGEVSQEITLTTGIPSETPIIMGGADTQCGLLGMNVTLGEVAAVGGTTTPVQLIIDKPLIDTQRRTWSNNHIKENQWIIESNCGYTGRNVRWAKQNLGFEDYLQLNEEAKKTPVGSNGLLSYLGAHVFNAGPPYWKMDKLSDLPVKQTIVGGVSPTQGEQVRSILESNCYAVKANLNQILDITGTEVSMLKFCGGNSKSLLWMQIQADVLGIPVIVPEVRDGTAIGAAILASVGSGYYSSVEEAASNMVRFDQSVYPNARNVKAYESHYCDWIKTRKTLTKL